MPEVVEHGHFEIGTRERRRQFLADGVEDPHAGQFLDALGQQFLTASRSFLRCRLIACLAGMNGALLVPADVLHHGSRLCSVDDDGGLSVRAFRFLGDAAILSFVEDIGLRIFRLPGRSLRNGKGFLARLFEGLHANLDQGCDLGAIAGAVGADRFVPDFGKQQRVVTRALWTHGATPCRWQQVHVVGSKGRVADVEKDFPLNPLAQKADGYGFGLLVFEDGRGAGRSVVM